LRLAAGTAKSIADNPFFWQKHLANQYKEDALLLAGNHFYVFAVEMGPDPTRPDPSLLLTCSK